MLRFGLVGLLALLVAASWPALTGTHVYDDHTLLDNPLLDGPEDVVGAWTHTSDDYVAAIDPGFVPGMGATTWRPIPMATLAAGQALGGSTVVHHAISLGIHLAVCALLFFLLGRGPGALAVVAWVALHPALGEAWLWINGRSDALAGLALLALAWALRARGVGGAVGAALAGAAGLLCKITFAPAAAALVVAEALGRKTSVGAVVGAGLGGAAALLARGWLLSRPGGGGTGLSLLGSSELYARVPHGLAMGVEALLLPALRPMRCLAWEHAAGWDAGELGALALLGAIGVALAIARAWRPLLLLGGAAATLLPTGIVGDVFWLGFDRYLYLPAVLVALAMQDGLPAFEERVRAARRPLAWGLGAAVFGTLALTLAGTASLYTSQTRWVMSMADVRPDDPTGWLLRAFSYGKAGEPALGHEALAQIDPATLPVPLALFEARARQALGDFEGSIAALEATYTRFPDSRAAQLRALTVRLRTGRGDPTALLEQLLADPVACPVVERLLDAEPHPELAALRCGESLGVPSALKAAQEAGAGAAAGAESGARAPSSASTPDELTCGSLHPTWTPAQALWPEPRLLAEATPDEQWWNLVATVEAVGAVPDGPCAGRILLGRVEAGSPDKGSFLLGPDWDGYGPDAETQRAIDAVPAFLTRFVETDAALLVLVGDEGERDEAKHLAPVLAAELGKPLRWATDATTHALVAAPETEAFAATLPLPDGSRPTVTFQRLADHWRAESGDVLRARPNPDGTHTFYAAPLSRRLAAEAVVTSQPMPDGGACTLLSAERTVELLPVLEPLGTVVGTETPVMRLPAGHPHVAALEAARRASETEAREHMQDIAALADDGVLRAWFTMTPYGRALQCLDERMRPIQLAEPLLYLYPPAPTRVSVAVGGVDVVASRPPYAGGWTVEAQPNGQLVDLATGRPADALFWEAPAGWWPMPERGWVIAGKGLGPWLEAVLPRLGLSDDEAEDFVTFWADAHADTPWVRVGLLPQPFVDAIAPLRIDPPPDTLLRVHLDFESVDGPQDLEPPELPEVPRREGFVVVEWSGTVR